MRLALALCVLVALSTATATKIRFRSQDLHAVAERGVPIASSSVGSLSPTDAAEPGMEGMNAEEWPADTMDASVIPNSNDAEIFSRHRFAPAADVTNYQATVKPPAPSTPTPAPTAPATPAPAAPAPAAPVPSTPAPATPVPPSYQGPVTKPPSPYQGPVPPPSPYQGPVPPPSPYQGPVKPSGYQGPPPGYQGSVPGKGGRFGLGGNVSEQIVAQGVDYSALPADYQAALRTGNLVVLNGKPGPKGPQGDMGIAGPINETTMKEIKTLHDKLVVHLAERRELARMEGMVYPLWIRSKYVCPDGWVPLGYVESELRFQCRPPGDGRTPGNEACNEIASFPKIYDRCGWSMHCRAPWTRYGCYTPPNIAGTAAEVKATVVASKAAEAGVPTVVITSPIVPKPAGTTPAPPNSEFNPIVKPIALNPNLTAAQVLNGTLSLQKTQFETQPVSPPTNPFSTPPKDANIPNSESKKERGPFAAPYPVNVSVQHSLQPSDLKNATNLLDEIFESLGKSRTVPVDFNAVVGESQKEKNSTELIDQTIYSFKQKHNTDEDDMNLDRYAIQLNE